MPPVVSLAAMGHASVAEKSIRIGVSAGLDVFDGPDAGRGEPRHHIAGEIEHEMLLACGRAEEARVRLVRVYTSV